MIESPGQAQPGLPTLPREEPTPPAAGTEPSIRLRGLRKEFGPVTAVDGWPGHPVRRVFRQCSGAVRLVRHRAALIAAFELPPAGTIEL